MKRFFFAKAKTPKVGEVWIYEDIGDGWFGGITAKAFAEELKKVGEVDELNVYINSYGGEVFAGNAIYNQLKRHKARKIVHIDGIAASIASVIAMAGDEIRIPSNGLIMIHKAWGVAIGNDDDMRKTADELGKINGTIEDTYVARTQADLKDIRAWMTAETWMNAEEAKSRGFADVITAEKAIEASASPLVRHFRNAPQNLSQSARSANVLIAAMNQRADRIRRASPATT